MPLYEYACRTCGKRFERLRTISEADVATACPQCGTEGARRLLSMFVSYSSKAADPAALYAGGGCGCSVGGCGCH
ncbi:MAG: zinc ribbon domain-containing protein [Chloroflexi bacterium]|nr:zinc ribbon domain-containing protein [Chloroflexota bacterium]